MLVIWLGRERVGGVGDTLEGGVGDGSGDLGARDSLGGVDGVDGVDCGDGVEGGEVFAGDG